MKYTGPEGLEATPRFDSGKASLALVVRRLFVLEVDGQPQFNHSLWTVG